MKRLYSIPAYGARETNGDNPVMAPEVTMELVKRIYARKEQEEEKMAVNASEASINGKWMDSSFRNNPKISVPPLG